MSTPEEREIDRLTADLADARYALEISKGCCREAEEVGAENERLLKVVELAADVRWKELADGAQFTVIDRAMLRDLYGAASRVSDEHRNGEDREAGWGPIGGEE